ncbi:MAG TPA: choice-of-anchor Q domain-containing protein [Sandaracinaceae bacterium LLY-WYZ-13_1]|nr:choice-of-anchor Q domain-containing protein [Sandaracinaceae bacterium LLY-WYZ-13_1]
MKRSTILSFSFLLLLLGGCSCDTVVATDDDGGPDGLPDAGPSGDDDAGPGDDGGPTDPEGGPTDPDGGPADPDASTCVDADGDGVTDCDGDCDDADPLTHPGAAEICGDGVDNACGTDADPSSLCGGIGTYVSTAGDDSSGDGTRDAPVRTIAQGIANAVTIGGATTVVVAGGTYDETVTLVDGVSIAGGFDCPSLPCSWAHDPAAHETIVDGGSGANAMEADDTISRATVLEDLTLLAGSTGLRIIGGSPIVRRVRVDAQTGITSWSGGDPRIESSTIVGAFAGVTMEGDGEIVTSDVEGAPAIRTRGPSLVQHNAIHASGDTGIWVGGSTLIDGNVINEDASRVGTCASSSGGFCSGVAIWGGSPELTNNVIYGMGGAMSSAIAIVHGELTVEEPLVHSNTLYVSRTPGGAGSIAAGVTCRSFFGLAEFGEIRNNIVIGADAGTSYGFYEEDHTAGRQCRPVLMENNAFFDVDHVARFSGTPSETLYTSVSDANTESWATGNLSTDPMLDADHRLQAGSGCIDQGTATEAPSVDRDGDARPAGGGYDIGADERP